MAVMIFSVPSRSYLNLFMRGGGGVAEGVTPGVTLCQVPVMAEIRQGWLEWLQRSHLLVLFPICDRRPPLCSTLVISPDVSGVIVIIHSAIQGEQKKKNWTVFIPEVSWSCQV